MFLPTELIFYSVSPPFLTYFQQPSPLQLSHASRILFPLFNFGLLSLAVQKVSIVQHKVYIPFKGRRLRQCVVHASPVISYVIN
jgi:hypothetical protein